MFVLVADRSQSTTLGNIISNHFSLSLSRQELNVNSQHDLANPGHDVSEMTCAECLRAGAGGLSGGRLS